MSLKKKLKNNKLTIGNSINDYNAENTNKLQFFGSNNMEFFIDAFLEIICVD